MNRLLEDFHGPGLSAFDTCALYVGRVSLGLLGAFLAFGIGSWLWRISVPFFRNWFTEEEPFCTCIRLNGDVKLRDYKCKASHEEEQVSA